MKGGTGVSAVFPASRRRTTLLFLIISLLPATNLDAQQRRRPTVPAKAPAKASPSSSSSPTPTAGAQPAMSPVKSLLEQNRLTAARQSIDAYLANPRNPKTAEAWYMKGKVYSAIAADPKTQGTMPDGRRLALEAFRKSIETDRNQAVLLLTVDGYQPVFALYTSAYQQGVDLYNTERFEMALTALREAATTGEFIYNQGWGLSRLDTTLALYTGLAAYRAGRQEETLFQFRKLADANIGPNADHATVYRYLAKYHFDRKDVAGMNRYIAAGQTLFPHDDFFPLLDIEWSRTNRDYRALFDKYERLVAAEPDRYEALMEYANELFGYTHDGSLGARPPDYMANCSRIEALYRRSANLRPASEEAWLSLGKHFYNQALVLDQESTRLPGKTRDDQQRKTDLSTRSAALAGQAIPALEHVFRHLDGKKDLTATQASYLRSACSLLSFCHALKKEYPAADAYRQRFDALK